MFSSWEEFLQNGVEILTPAEWDQSTFIWAGDSEILLRHVDGSVSIQKPPGILPIPHGAIEVLSLGKFDMEVDGSCVIHVMQDFTPGEKRNFIFKKILVHFDRLPKPIFLDGLPVAFKSVWQEEDGIWHASMLAAPPLPMINCTVENMQLVLDLALSACGTPQVMRRLLLFFAHYQIYI